MKSEKFYRKKSVYLPQRHKDTKFHKELMDNWFSDFTLHLNFAQKNSDTAALSK